VPIPVEHIRRFRRCALAPVSVHLVWMGKSSTLQGRTSRGWQRRWLIVVAAVAAVILVAMLAHVRDPTEGTVTVSIVNDTGRTIFLSMCEDGQCQHVASGGDDLTPGDALRQNVQANSVVPFFTHDVVPQTASPVRCLRLTIGDTVASSYSVSQLLPCA
jgi:hypothetical protein